MKSLVEIRHCKCDIVFGWLGSSFHLNDLHVGQITRSVERWAGTPIPALPSTTSSHRSFLLLNHIWWIVSQSLKFTYQGVRLALDNPALINLISRKLGYFVLYSYESPLLTPQVVFSKRFMRRMEKAQPYMFCFIGAIHNWQPEHRPGCELGREKL